jgi:WD40 repeat protein
MFHFLPILLMVVSLAVQAQPQLVVNTGHTDDVTSVVLTSDRKLALTGSKDQTARIWDVATGKEKLRLSDHDDWVNAAVFSPDDRFVATGTADSHINLYSASDGKLISKTNASGWFIVSVAFTPDGKHIVSADRNGDVVVWTADLGNEVRRIPTELRISAAALTPKGTEILVGSEDGEMIGFRLADGERLQRFNMHKKEITSIATFRDLTEDLAIISASQDGKVFVWNALSGEGFPHSEFSGDSIPGWEPGDFPTAIAFSPDYRQIAVGHQSGRLRTIDIYERKQLNIGDAHENARINGIAFSQDSTAVISGAERGEAKLWRVSDGKTLGRFAGRVDSVEKIDVRPDERALASGSGHLDHEVSGWSLTDGTNIGRLPGNDRVRSLQFSPADQNLLAYTFDDPGLPITFWNSASERRIAFDSPFQDEAVALAFSPDGRRILAYGRFGGQVLEVETRDSADLPELDFPVGVAALIEEYTSVDSEGNQRIETITYELPPGLTSAAWSPDGQHIAMGVSNETGLDFIEERNFAFVYEVDSGEQREIGPVRRGVTSLQFSRDGRQLLISSDGGASVWDVETGENIVDLDHDGTYLNIAIWMPDGQHVVTGGRDRVVRVWDITGGTKVSEFKGHTSAINDLKLLNGGEIIVSASKDGTIRLWDTVRGGELAQLVSFGRQDRRRRDDSVARRGGEWAVIDSAGRYDASNGGDVEGLHWIVDGRVIQLSQLKERYYEPGLLAKLLGFNPEPLRDVSRFSEAGVRLYPTVKDIQKPDREDPFLRFTVTNSGGGIGPVQVLINGKELIADARPPGSDPQAASLNVAIDLTDNRYFVPGEDNEIEIVASNAEQTLKGRGGRFRIPGGTAPVSRGSAPLSIWTVAVGVSDYRGSQIDLQFAHKDAADFASAMQLAAEGLAPGRAHVTLINGDSLPADKATVQRTLEDIAGKASANDILVIYLAGHGVTSRGQDPDYYYLLQDASSMDISDTAIRDQVAISSQELTELINKVDANKQVLIMDTCAAGQLITDLVTSRGVPSAQMRSIERMKDRTGMYVLAGSAADAESYETTRFGQGLVTYSILEGMRGMGRNERDEVDVDRLFNHALERVTSLARGLGGVQQPRISAPERGTFYIGHLTDEDAEKIKLAVPKPVVISSMFQDQEQIRDHLNLASRVDAALREAAESGKSYFVFFSADHYPDAYALAGRYEISGEDIAVTVVMSRGRESVEKFMVNGTTGDLPALEASLIREMEARLSRVAD